jgi:ribosomal protein L40E
MTFATGSRKPQFGSQVCMRTRAESLGHAHALTQVEINAWNKLASSSRASLTTAFCRRCKAQSPVARVSPSRVSLQQELHLEGRDCASIAENLFRIFRKFHDNIRSLSAGHPRALRVKFGSNFPQCGPCCPRQPHLLDTHYPQSPFIKRVQRHGQCITDMTSFPDIASNRLESRAPYSFFLGEFSQLEGL